MNRDILLEVYAAKEAYAAEHGFDVMAIIADLNRKSKAAGRTIVNLPPRPAIEVTVAPRPKTATPIQAETNAARAG